MWSTVVLSTGLVLLIGCATAGIILLRKQLHHGTTGFGVLATSDSILSAVIGMLLVGLGLSREDAQYGVPCSETMILASASAFLLPFVNSFLSMFLMSVECWVNAMTAERDVEDRSCRILKNGRKRIALETVVQWLLPIFSVIILYQMTPNSSIVNASKTLSLNNSCQVMDMFPLPMADGCHEEITVDGGNEQLTNFTNSVVQRVYQLINGSASDADELLKSYYIPSRTQAKEEWKDIIMHLTNRVPDQRGEMINRSLTIKQKGRSVQCDEVCESSIKRVQAYLTGLITTLYAVPMIGTILFHRSTKEINKLNQARVINEPDLATTSDTGAHKVCHLKEIKMMAFSNFLMWTPSLAEKFAKDWLCSSAPKWLVAILFIIGQMSNVIRGATNANASHTTTNVNKNVVIPINSNIEISSQEQSVQAADRTEVLFHKRSI